MFAGPIFDAFVESATEQGIQLASSLPCYLDDNVDKLRGKGVYRRSIAALIVTDGPERNTLQWAEDGINFEIMSHIKSGPPAVGLVRALDHDASPLAALEWGLTHQYVSYDWQYIRRFERVIPRSP